MRDARDLISTIFTKSIGLLSSFGLVVLSTHLLGAEGRGYVTLTITDAALLAIFSNILSGSSSMYYLNKFGESKVIITAIVWILFVSFLGTALLTIIHPTNFWLVFSLSVVLSFNSLVYNQLFANQRILKGNLLAISVQAAFFLVLFIVWLFNFSLDWVTYFEIQLVIWSIITLIFIKPLKIELLNLNEFRAVFIFGFRNELSYMFQFISYRFSYFIIYYQLGIESLGVFGLMIIIAESIWVISRSFSSVSFAKQLVDEGENDSVHRTNQYTRLTFFLSAIALLLLLVIPEYWFLVIFSSEFSGLKSILIVVAPGILAVAASTVIGHYFAAKNRQWVLIFKSFLGLILTCILSPIFISLYGIWGAALAMCFSYLASSFVLFFMYYRRVF